MAFWNRKKTIAQELKTHVEPEEAAPVEKPKRPLEEAGGNRIGFVMNRMYRLVVSVDLDLNSYVVECGSTQFSKGIISAGGRYSDFIKTVASLTSEMNYRKLTELIDINSITDSFREGKSWREDIIRFDGMLMEVRVERIPEIDPRSSRSRCCVFFRPVNSLEDDGSNETVLGGYGKSLQGISENEKVIAAIYTGAYEINLVQDVLVGFEKCNGVFARPGERCPMVTTIRNWMENGIIHENSKDFYKNICSAGFLKKKTLEGRYTKEVLLKSPGAANYRWYEETVFPLGDNFLVYRKDINSFKKLREEKIREREQERFDRYNREMLRTVAELVEFRNMDCGDHIHRVNEVTRILLEDLAERSPQFGLTPQLVRLYTEASTLHDIGKITIPDAILNKAGKLTEEERFSMRDHTVKGAEIIDRMSAVGHEEMNRCSRDVALHHHERYDGGGYPEGLKGDQISIGAQVVGLADAFDALSSARIYKAAYSCEKSIEMLEAGACGAFQPKLLESLRFCFDKVKRIYETEAKSAAGNAEE